jgi:hypothetical protein
VTSKDINIVEQVSRLKELFNGPWMKSEKAVSKFLGSRTIDAAGFDSMKRISVLQLHSAAKTKDLSREKSISKTLRSHWNARIIDVVEIANRTALDEYLTLFQLIELAVETEYVPLEFAVSFSRTKLIELAWTPSFTRYLVSYDYLSVLFLMERCGIDTGTGVHPPSSTDAEVRFATFLSHCIAIWEDPFFPEFTDLLDDYSYDAYENAKDDFLSLLKTGNIPTKKKSETEFLLKLKNGLSNFISMIGGAYQNLEDQEIKNFGLYHAYWLAKFFGYKLEDSGYLKSGVDWYRIVIGSPLFVAPSEVDPKEAGHLGNSLETNAEIHKNIERLAASENVAFRFYFPKSMLDTLRTTWGETRTLVIKSLEKSKSKPDSRKKEGLPKGRVPLPNATIDVKPKIDPGFWEIVIEAKPEEINEDFLQKFREVVVQASEPAEVNIVKQKKHGYSLTKMNNDFKAAIVDIKNLQKEAGEKKKQVEKGNDFGVSG